MNAEIRVINRSANSQSVIERLTLPEGTRGDLSLRTVRDALQPLMRGIAFDLQVLQNERADVTLMITTSAAVVGFVALAAGRLDDSHVRPHFEKLAQAAIGVGPAPAPTRLCATLRVERPGEAPLVINDVPYFSAEPRAFDCSVQELETAIGALLEGAPCRVALAGRTPDDRAGARVRVDRLSTAGSIVRTAVLDLPTRTSIAGVLPALRTACDALTSA